jgi:hypothetical protein
MKTMDPVLKLLLVGILFFTAALFYCEHRFPSDGQIFQVIAGLLTGFGGAFLAFARKELGVPDEPASGAQRTIDTVTTTVTAKNVTIPPQETK